ncbi:MAG: 1-acyl-sn-glycerol-3-phosphate acyltransferase [Acidobacteria bacterium]|nr:1-acyl-sn-glycerol-3-phosphate acyltransferase [Acidobacteriota bacterium]
MKKPLRLIRRLCAVTLVTGGLYALWLIGLPLVLAFAPLKSAWRNWIFRHWAKGMAWAINLHITFAGVPPTAPFYLVSNHLSYVDIFAFAAHLDCVFVSKSEIKDWPLIGLLCRSMDTIFIDRERRTDIPRVIRLIEKAWKKKQGVIIFPEGTSSKGAEVLPFKAALLEPAVKAALPVSYASITYQTAPADTPAYLSVCWWGKMTFMPHAFDLFRLSQIDAKIVFGSSTFLEADRKILAQKLHRAIAAQFTPVTLAEEPCQAATAP